MSLQACITDTFANRSIAILINGEPFADLDHVDPLRGMEFDWMVDDARIQEIRQRRMAASRRAKREALR